MYTVPTDVQLGILFVCVEIEQEVRVSRSLTWCNAWWAKAASKLPSVGADLTTEMYGIGKTGAEWSLEYR
jgi:hypothetical protein